MPPKNPDWRCNDRTKNGKRCRAAATASGRCYFHANPDKASELGRIGGRSKRHAAGENLDPLPTLDNVLAVRDTLARLSAEVYGGKVPPRIVSCLTSLMKVQMRAIETTNLALRLAKVEELLAAKDELHSNDGAPGSDFSQLRKPSRKV
jgi:hypothetical protein